MAKRKNAPSPDPSRITLQYALECIAALNEWIGKADADYVRVLAELSDLKRRVAKLERPGKAAK